MQTTAAAEATENPAILKLRLAKLGVSVADASLARAGALVLVLPDESWARRHHDPMRVAWTQLGDSLLLADTGICDLKPA